MVDFSNIPVEDLISSQLQSEEEFTDSFQAVYSHKFQITEEKNLPQALTCRLAQLVIKLKLFHVVERTINVPWLKNVSYKLPFVNSTKSLIFDLTKILLPKRLVLTYSLIAKVMHYQILFTELKSNY